MRKRRAQLAAALSLFPLCASAYAGVGDSAWLVARSGHAAPGVPGFAFSGILADNTGTALPAPLMSGNVVVVSGSLRQGMSLPPTERGLWLMRADGATRLVARHGQSAPGTESGTTFQQLSTTTANQDGCVLLISSLTGPGVVPGLNSRGMWSADFDRTSLVIRESQVAPDTSPVGYFRTLSEGIGLDGSTSSDIGVRAVVTSLPGEQITVPYTTGTWIRRNQQLKMVTWSYGDAPGVPGAWVSDAYDVISSSGRGAYTGRIYGPPVGSVVINGTTVQSDWCLWRADEDGRELIARTTSPAPGAGSGVVFRSLPGATNRPAVNAAGDIAFSATVIGPGIGSSNSTGLWRSTDAGVSLIARGGSPATAAGTGVVFDSLYANSSDGSLAVLDNGDVVFWTYFAGTGVNLNNCRGIWKRSPSGQDTMIARSGVSNGALPSGTTLVRTTLPLAMKASGDDHVMFTAQLTGGGVDSGNNDILLRHTNEHGLQIVAREGSTYGNHVLKSFVNNGADMQITGTGFAVVPAMFSPASNPNATPVLGALGVSRSGAARVLAVANHPIALSDGTFPTIGQLRIASKGAISNDGRVAMAASFGSGTPRDEGVFVVTIDLGYEPPTPCPADYDRSGSLTTEDVFSFLHDWFRGEADYDQSGYTDVVDIFEFLADYFHGCD